MSKIGELSLIRARGAEDAKPPPAGGFIAPGSFDDWLAWNLIAEVHWFWFSSSVVAALLQCGFRDGGVAALVDGLSTAHSCVARSRAL